MNVAIIPNPEKDPGLQVTKELCDYLHGRATLLLHEDYEGVVSYARFLSTDALYASADFAVVLGGDGTLLHAAKNASRHHLPIMGINLGHLGFLAQTGREGMKDCIDGVLAGDYTVENRMMLDARVYRDGELIKAADVLNDVIVSRFSMLRMIRVQLYLDGKLIQSSTADGLILATPTGSTAYSLSAGGPIIDPEAEVVLATPVCPHNLLARSIVVPTSKNLTIEFAASYSPKAIVRFDGADEVTLQEGDYVAVQKSENATKLIRVNHINFYDILYEKLS